jgi:hypothetical protein
MYGIAGDIEYIGMKIYFVLARDAMFSPAVLATRTENVVIKNVCALLCVGACEYSDGGHYTLRPAVRTFESQ